MGSRKNFIGYISLLSVFIAFSVQNSFAINDSVNEFEKTASEKAGIGDYNTAVQIYDKGIALCDEDLKTDPVNYDALNNKCQLLKGRSIVEEVLSKYDNALADAQESLQLAEILISKSHNSEAHIEKADALRFVASIQAELSQYRDAENTYRLALAAADKALDINADSTDALNSKASTLEALGQLFNFHLSRREEGVKLFNQASDLCDRSLKIIPESTDLVNEKIRTLLPIAQSEQALGQFDKARVHLEEALKLARLEKEKSPESLLGLMDEGDCLRAKARLEVAIEDDQSARDYYSRAQKAYSEAIAKAPHKPSLTSKVGWLHVARAELESRMHQKQASIDHYVEALRNAEDALVVAPNSTAALYLKTWTLVGMLKELDLCQRGDIGIKDANASLAQLTKIAPDYAKYHGLSAAVLQADAYIHRFPADYTAIKIYQRAIKEYDKTLEVAPGLTFARVRKGDCYGAIAQEQLWYKEYKDAIESRKSAIAVFEETSELEPTSFSAASRGASAYLDLAWLYEIRRMPTLAIESCNKAIARCDFIQSTRPDSVWTLKMKAYVLGQKGNMFLNLGRSDDAIDCFKSKLRIIDAAISKDDSNKTALNTAQKQIIEAIDKKLGRHSTINTVEDAYSKVLAEVCPKFMERNRDISSEEQRLRNLDVYQEAMIDHSRFQKAILIMNEEDLLIERARKTGAKTAWYEAIAHTIVESRARCEERIGKPRLALLLYQSAPCLSELAPPGDAGLHTVGQVLILKQIAELQEKLGNRKSAIATLTRACDLCTRAVENNQGFRLDALESLAEALETRGTLQQKGWNCDYEGAFKSYCLAADAYGDIAKLKPDDCNSRLMRQTQNIEAAKVATYTSIPEQGLERCREAVHYFDQESQKEPTDAYSHFMWEYGKRKLKKLEKSAKGKSNVK